MTLASAHSHLLEKPRLAEVGPPRHAYWASGGWERGDFRTTTNCDPRSGRKAIRKHGGWGYGQEAFYNHGQHDARRFDSDGVQSRRSEDSKCSLGETTELDEFAHGQCTDSAGGDIAIAPTKP